MMKMPDAAERKVVIITTFVSGCITLMPQEWTSASVLLIASGLMFLGDRRLKRREKGASATPSATGKMPTAETPTTAAEATVIAAEAAPRAESAAPAPPAL